MVIYAGVEGGGTTWRVAIADGHPTNITESKSFVTVPDAKEQLRAIKEWLSTRKYDCLGIGTFGPIDPREGSPTYGYITSTPKPGWNMVDVVGYLSDGSVPCKFDTDVNAPALAEFMWGAKKAGESSCAYITVGTGVGVGLVVNGQAVHGLMHPEAGHLCLKRMPGDDFPGVDSVFGGASVEGLASTVALAARKASGGEDLPGVPDSDPVWEATAHSLAGLCASLVLVVSPERIVLSGGVMNRTLLYDKVRKWTRELLNGYIDHPAVTTDAVDDYITPSSFGQNAGMVGSLTLAHIAYEEAGGRGGGPGSPTATKTGGVGACLVSPCNVSVALAAAAVVGLGALAIAKASKK
ncbi:unnamed protein product [Ectocarpus sp. 12 AP-2014]